VDVSTHQADRAPPAASHADPARYVEIALALAAVGRETDDISSRLFVEATRNAIAEATWARCTTRNREVGGSNPPGAIPVLQRMPSEGASPQSTLS
jgi:hypothetical protein